MQNAAIWSLAQANMLMSEPKPPLLGKYEATVSVQIVYRSLRNFSDFLSLHLSGRDVDRLCQSHISGSTCGAGSSCGNRRRYKKPGAGETPGRCNRKKEQVLAKKMVK